MMWVNGSMSNIVDFHTHILPEIDDGSSGLSESIAMLRKQAEQGIAHVIATPHFYAKYDSPERFLRRRDLAEARLREEMSKYDGLPKLSVGAEVYYFSGISDSDSIQELTFSGGQCILIEMPTPPWTEQMYRELEGIWSKKGLIPIVAHVDRYISPFRTHHIPERLSKLPVLVQANAEFFLRKATAGMAVRMLRDGRIHLLGSDCHDLSERPPELGQAIGMIQKRLGQSAVERIIRYQNKALSEK